MKYYTNDCVNCGLPCIFEACPYYKAKHFKCDFCKEEDIKLYDYDGFEICGDCLLKEFNVIEGTEDW